MAQVAIMNEEPVDEVQRQRLLECWLPLAQQAMLDLGARYAPAELEALILDSALDLAATDSATTARAVLWRQHRRNRSTRQ